MKVVIAGRDYGYIEKIEDYILNHYIDCMELIIYTEQDMLKENIAILHQADCIIIDENIYWQFLNHSFLARVFLLKETPKAANTQQLHIQVLDKYSSVKEIVKTVFAGLDVNSICEDSHKTQVIKISSACGGSGKTSLSLALALCIHHMDRKVLYINFENINHFQYFLSSNQSINLKEARQLKNEKILDKELQKIIQKYHFDYLLPFISDIRSLGLTKEIYNQMIMKEKKRNDYDFIIVDAVNEIDNDFTHLMKFVDIDIYIIEESQYSLFKTMIYLKNLSFSQSKSPLFVCNKSMNPFKRSFKIEDMNYKTISNIPYEEKMTIDLLSQNKELQKLAMYILSGEIL